MDEKKRWIVTCIRNGTKYFVKSMVLPPQECKLTDNIAEAYLFHDREWLQEKLNYYGCKKFQIKEITNGKSN
jgi:hypothetical protein